VRRGRSRWRDWPLLGWLTAAVVVALTHRWLPQASWLLLHLVLLGAITHSILVWSAHFAATLLRLPAPAGQDARLAVLTAGAIMVVVGVPLTWWPLVLAGGTAVAASVGWHALVLARMLRRALPARFRVTVRYYLAASACLLVGAALGVTLAWGWDDTWHGRLLVAHALTNLLGWVGLTLTGTLLTLWPTMLRTRMDATADAKTRQALPVFLAGVAVSAGGALVGLAWLAAVGLVLFVAGLALWGRALWRPFRTKPPTEFAAASVGVSLLWLVAGLAWAGWVLVTAPDWHAVHEGFAGPAAALGAGFGVQVLTGALSYLLPSVLGGGPSVVRAGQRWFDAAAGFRLVAINGGLLLWLAPTPGWVKVAGSVLALGAGGAFLPILVGGIRASVKARRAVATGTELPESPRRPPVGSSGQLIAGFTAVLVAVVAGIGMDPAAAGLASAAHATVPATGAVVRVRVEIREMRYVPASVAVNPGDRLVVELTNADTTTHDLVIGDARTPRIGPGASVELDAGVVATSTQGYCSVVGHRQLGMVFDVVVAGTPPSPTPTTGQMPMDHAGAPPAPDAPAPAVVDPTLPPLVAERVHRVRLEAREQTLEVAPGVWQRRWTFGGRVPGPTLHGRVGDVFEVTLVNSASIGHSIDFHAGALAPDRPMRTIAPGETLVYRFTAHRAGIWMYHCGTMPMTAHIGAGMFGAVVIEPAGLPPVDRSFLLVQSENYVQAAAADPSAATEVDAAAAAAGRPSGLAFNGVAFGYDRTPLAARVGERVRFWVLDAGPNRAGSFHIVGAQFDTVYSEGGYLLRDGRDAFGSRGGGSQALALAPAQGGFVETVFAEPGHYAFVSHAMADAELGAHGVVAVS
jgi:nitrite reductase (NO-forming)